MGRRKNSRSPFGYFIEFIIIITGIMVSFLVNEWRENKNLEEKKNHLLIEINSDLEKDSLMFEAALNFYTTMIKSHDSLLLDRNKTFIEDSLHDYLDHVVSYFPFQETATTYHKILNNQEFSFDSEDTIIQHYMNLHNLSYTTLHEWLSIDKDFVRNQALPYMDQNAPFIYPTPKMKSFHGAVFYELRKDDAFMNMIKSGRLYKTAMIQMSTGVFNYMKYIKAKVRKRIKENVEAAE